jgi:hypothetical protein
MATERGPPTRFMRNELNDQVLHRRGIEVVRRPVLQLRFG